MEDTCGEHNDDVLEDRRVCPLRVSAAFWFCDIYSTNDLRDMGTCRVGNANI